MIEGKLTIRAAIATIGVLSLAVFAWRVDAATEYSRQLDFQADASPQ
jgi:hypothetical protein